MAPILSVVATPIGNLEDITLRALRTLKESDVIFCEDTRVTRNLLQRYDIHTSLRRLDAHTENKNVHEVLELLESGKHVSIVTDAGTPGISDPGSRAVAAVRAAFGATVKIEAIPGPSALTALLSISGLDVHQFVFYGFLPHKKGRQTLFKEIIASDKTSILYESPFRIIKTLESIVALDPNRRVIIGREITKFYEEVLDQTARETLEHFKKHEPKGEFVVMVTGRS
jgi:16S rRNA (cytidine1402-2'-O)-methyltransferase